MARVVKSAPVGKRKPPAAASKSDAPEVPLEVEATAPVAETPAEVPPPEPVIEATVVEAAVMEPIAEPEAPVAEEPAPTPAPEEPVAAAEAPVEAEPMAEPEMSVPEPEPEPVVLEPEAAKPAPAKSPGKKPLGEKPGADAPMAETTATKQPSAQPEERIMTAKPIDFTSLFSTSFTDFQEKAKAAYEKGVAALGDYSEFTKGNVEALVESSKIFASGLQELGSAFVADSRASFETVTAEVKELASVKSPTDFVKLQGELAKKHFDTAVSYGSKQSEAVLKLANEVAAPISGRVTLAIETIKKAA